MKESYTSELVEKSEKRTLTRRRECTFFRLNGRSAESRKLQQLEEAVWIGEREGTNAI
ncbi:MAG: hypothetical protein V3U24_08605 [Candidatus Neomarinimicrobiota bacterium]